MSCFWCDAGRRVFKPGECQMPGYVETEVGEIFFDRLAGHEGRHHHTLMRAGGDRIRALPTPCENPAPEKTLLGELESDTEELPPTPSEQESWYDAEIAPKLLEMGAACMERGIPFLSVVGYDGAVGSSSRTCCFPEQTPFFFRVLDMAARCWEDGGTFNLDRFCIAMARAVAGKPHDSMILKLMGVPPEGSGS